MYQRKKNKILSCERVSNEMGSGWVIYIESPSGKISHTQYLGYSKQEALYKARHKDIPAHKHIR